MQAANVRFWPALRLMVLGLSVTACATRLPPSEQTCPALPPMPAASEPQPSVNYSISAQEWLKAWRNALKGTLTTP